ncbi:hypothetical protein SAMN05444385_11261 [Tritonibacter mobilis]|nr:hypothetical protein SAMN05444385_11261 [Tritonibacter mobilis]
MESRRSRAACIPTFGPRGANNGVARKTHRRNEKSPRQFLTQAFLNSLAMMVCQPRLCMANRQTVNSPFRPSSLRSLIVEDQASACQSHDL